MRSIVVVVGLFVAWVVLAGCSAAVFPEVEASSEDHFPGKVAIADMAAEEVAQAVLDDLPVFPGVATPADDVIAGFATRPRISLCGGEQCPTVHTAVDRWQTEVSDEEVEKWYWERLVQEGYEQSGSSAGLNDDHYFSEVQFTNPAQPDVRVQRHSYYQPDGTNVFELMAVYLEPIPKPDGPVIPTDAERVDIVVQPSLEFEDG